jgi:hypothetical protein
VCAVCRATVCVIPKEVVLSVKTTAIADLLAGAELYGVTLLPPFSFYSHVRADHSLPLMAWGDRSRAWASPLP